MLKRLTKKQRLIILSSILGALILGGVLIARSSNKSPSDTSTVTPEQQKTAEESPASTESTETETQKEATLKQTQAENQAASQPQQTSFTLTLVRAEQIENVEIRALVSGTSAGICTVKFTGPGNAFSKSHAITFDGRTYSCGALDASTSDFSAGGKWNYSLTAENAGKNSNTLKGEITVQK